MDDVAKEMEYGANTTQYWYNLMGMPEVFRHKTLRPFVVLQSWWMNYTTKYWRELITRAVTGKTGWGKEIPLKWRLGALRHIFAASALVYGIKKAFGLDYKRTVLWGVMPTYLSPTGQITLGLYNYIFASSDWQRNQAKARIKQSYRAFIPGSLAIQDVKRALETGDIKELLTYPERPEIQLSEEQQEEYKSLSTLGEKRLYLQNVERERERNKEISDIREQVRETGEEKEFKGILYYRAKQFDKETGEEKFVVKPIKVREPTREEVYEGLTTAYETSEDAPENIIQKIKVYGTGLFKDPKGVIEAVRSGNPIRKIRGDAVIFERQRSLSKLDVGDVATEVDHIIPLALGGTNEESNLQIISKQDNRAKGQVDTYLAKLLDSGKITKKEAQERVLNWRNEINKLPESYKSRALAYLSAEPEIETKKIITSGLEDLEKIYIITDKSTGNKTKIDLSEPIESPELTGQTELDKKLISSYKSKITRRITAISKVYLDGQISAEDAEKLINYYQGLKSSATGAGKGRKPPKPSYTMPKLKTPTIPSTRVSAPQFKFTKYNLPKTKKRAAFRIIPPKGSSIYDYITR